MTGPFTARKITPATRRLTKKAPMPTLTCGVCQNKVCEVARLVNSVVWLCAVCENLEQVAEGPVGTPLDSGIHPKGCLP